MDQKAEDGREFVEEVVRALTCAESPGEGGAEEPGGDLLAQMQRAAAEFDRRTAEAFGQALVNSLCDDPSNVRMLEALIILGVAHPDVLRRHGVSLAQEGRRLAVLLEHAGEVERARTLLELLATRLPGDRGLEQDLQGLMRRQGETDELVERCLRRADEAVQAGKPAEAIPWLQEVLLHDRGRRDVARMIRDLRYQEVAERRRRMRRRKAALVGVLISALATAGVVREARIRDEMATLPVVCADDPASIAARLAALDELVAEHRLWLGRPAVSSERAQLRIQLDRLEAKAAEQRRAAAEAARERAERAEAARLEGRIACERGEFREALALFRRALALGDPDWSRRPRIEADVRAIEAWLAQEGR